jgi:hypothetical protein
VLGDIIEDVESQLPTAGLHEDSWVLAGRTRGFDVPTLSSRERSCQTTLALTFLGALKDRAEVSMNNRNPWLDLFTFMSSALTILSFFVPEKRGRR